MVQCDPVATIDLSNFQTRKAEITQQLMTAASDIGFFRVKGMSPFHWNHDTMAAFCLLYVKTW